MKDKRIDAYIAKSLPFAQPILKHLRKLVHEACPDIEETIKWGMPSFGYNGIVCHMASFKQHCVFGFWKATLMKDSKKLFSKEKDESAMGHLGRITSLKDLPSDKILLQYIKEAVKLNEERMTLPKKKSTEKKTVKVPVYFKSALGKNKKAKTYFEAFNYSQKKDYIEWIAEAKTDATREKRIATALEWISEGKGRNWKYEKKVKG